MKLAWLTDIHLNFLRPPALEAFLDSLADTEAEAFLLTGDFAEADYLPPMTPDPGPNAPGARGGPSSTNHHRSPGRSERLSGLRWLFISRLAPASGYNGATLPAETRSASRA